MSFLSGVDGVTALVLLCSLLFLEEAGVPLPFAPGELVLIAAGLLIASGGLPWWLFIPAAWLACGLGVVVAYSWARAIGPLAMRALAGRLHAGRSYDRVATRLRAAGPLEIAVSRLIPGLRIYTTLVGGAVGIKRSTFLLGALPAMAVWVVVFTVLGAVVGLPAERAFGHAEQLALRGAVLGLAGVGAYIAVRHVPAAERHNNALAERGAVRTVLAAAIDLGVLASILLAAGRIARLAFGLQERAGWIEAVVIGTLVLVAYLIVARRGAGATAGERLLNVSYMKRPAQRPARETSPRT